MTNNNQRDFIFYLGLLFIAVSIQVAGCSVRMGLKELAEQKECVR